MCVWDRHGRLDGKLRRRGCWAMLVMIYPCQEKFEGIHNNIFTEVSTSKEKHFSCVDFIGANVLAPPPPPGLSSPERGSSEVFDGLSYTHTHTFTPRKGEGWCLHTVVCTSLTSLIHTHTHTPRKGEGTCLHTVVCTSLTSLIHAHTHTHTQEGRRMVSTRGGVHLFDVSHTHTHTQDIRTCGAP